MKLPIIFCAVAFLFIRAVPARAATYQPTSDCVIDSLHEELWAHTDSSLKVQETIAFNCGDLAGKHGMFRVLPTREGVNLKNGHWVQTPITLESITDETGKPYQFATSWQTDTETWKIGDPNVLITGTHTYVLTYDVKNALAYEPARDGLIWNVAGQFWNNPINAFEATVHMPDGVSQNQVAAALYSGPQGAADNQYNAVMNWINNTTFSVTSDALPPQTGVTVLALFPTGIITPYVPTTWELAVQKGWPLPFLLFAIVALYYWPRYGRGPQPPNVVAPEFEVPGGLRPAELLKVEGSVWKNDMVTPTIIDLAVRGYLRLEKPTKGSLFHPADTLFTLLNSDYAGLKEFEMTTLDWIFRLREKGTQRSLSDIKSSMRLNPADQITYQSIAISVKADVDKLGLTDSSRKTRAFVSWVLPGLAVAGVMIWLDQAYIHGALAGAYLTSVVGGIIVLILCWSLTSVRTEAGAAMEGKIRGFKMYMSKAEEYRQRFFEKEGIYDKFLPYAIAFGLTKEWTKAMQAAYVETGRAPYVPVWYVLPVGANWDLDSFTRDLGAIPSAISSSVGGGGGGFSGGGGGGGGGGSW